MPALNGTGPRGQGPMTGRGLGNCGPGYRGFGRGFGFGRGWGWNYPYQPTAKEEKEMLEDEIKGMKACLEELKNKK